MKKYLLFGDANSPHLYKWYEELTKHYDVLVVTFTSATRFQYKKIASLGLNVRESGGNVHVLKVFFKFLGIIKKFSPDVINSHYVTSYGFLSALTSLFFKRVLVVSAWGTDILVTPNKGTVYRLLTRFVLNRADVVTSDSEVMTRRIHSLVPDANVLTFPMGIRKYQIYESTDKGDVFTFLSLRALVPNSNVDDIVYAFDSIASHFENVELVIAHTGSEEGALKKRALSLPSKNKIRFVGLLNAEELGQIMKSSNAYITIPTSDSLSVSLLEAMASELLIIASDLPANREFLSSECGWLIERGVEALTSAMEEVLLLPEKEQIRIYKQCREIVLHKAIWEDSVSEYVTTLREVV